MKTKLEGENVPERMASILLAKSQDRMIVRTAIEPGPVTAKKRERTGKSKVYLISYCQFDGITDGFFQASYQSYLKPSQWNSSEFEIAGLPSSPAEQDQWLAAQLLNWKESDPGFFTAEEIVEEIRPAEKSVFLSAQEFHTLLWVHYSRIHGLLEYYRANRVSVTFSKVTFQERLGAYLSRISKSWIYHYGPFQSWMMFH